MRCPPLITEELALVEWDVVLLKPVEQYSADYGPSRPNRSCPTSHPNVYRIDARITPKISSGPITVQVYAHNKGSMM